MSSVTPQLLLLTNEYPPYIYGGAGVHVDYLSRSLAKLMPVEVRSFGDQKFQEGNLSVTGFDGKGKINAPKHLHSSLRAAAIAVEEMMVGVDADLVHCHTWYTHLAGVMAKLLYGIPLVVTVHSLEPLRPWKREQIGHGYDFSCWVECQALEMADAIIAVSEGTQRDILNCFDLPKEKVSVIHNGIDLDEYRSSNDPYLPAHLEKAYGIDSSRPYLLFVGRITRQKGLVHLLQAVRQVNPRCQVVLCAGAPDTPEIAQEVKAEFVALQQERSGMIWLEEMLPREEVIRLYDGATVFVCPSVYEPFGLINVEAMACETAVIASAVGGIPEIVVEGETGLLVPFDSVGSVESVASVESVLEKKDTNLVKINGAEPANPQKFATDLAAAINQLLADPQRCKAMGKAGRARVERSFSWEKIAEETHQLYLSLLEKNRI